MKNAKPITKNGNEKAQNHKGSIVKNGIVRKATPKEMKPTSIEAQKASMRVFAIIFIISILKQV